MANLGPSLDYKILRDYPPKVGVRFEEQLITHKTIVGSQTFGSTGFIGNFSLSWDNSLVTLAQWEVLRTIANKKTNVNFVPFPDKFPNSSFTVRVIGGISGLDVFKYVETGFKGTLQLVTPTILDTIPAWAS